MSKHLILYVCTYVHTYVCYTVLVQCHANAYPSHAKHCEMVTSALDNAVHYAAVDIGAAISDPVASTI